MEIEESGIRSRKRSESNEGSSDSELSEGWNIVDQLDVNNHEVPSSDGESVEVIEAEEDASDQVTDQESEHDVGESHQLMTTPEPQVLPAPEADHGRLNRRHEDLFNMTFCWCLLLAVCSLMFSNLAFMIAEKIILNWEMAVNIGSPSFLRDLPVTPKPLQEDNFPNIISWAENEDVVVDTVDDMDTGKEQEDIIAERTHVVTDGNQKHHKHTYTEWQKRPLKVNQHEILKQLEVLGSAISSSTTQNKFSQVLLILDALQIGLKDLEEVVTDNSELRQVLDRQKSKLEQVVKEIDFGVSRSLERVASNILNKVQKLENTFENQWCKMEKLGHKEELKGLFYECHDESGKYDNNYMKYTEKYEKHHKNDAKKYDKTYKKYTEKYIKYYKDELKHFEFPNKELNNEDKKENKQQMIIDNYYYEVDKDTTGKANIKLDIDDKGSNDYYKLVKNIDRKNIKQHTQYKSADKNEFFKSKEGGNEKNSKQMDKNKSLNNNEKRSVKLEEDISSKHVYNVNNDYTDDEETLIEAASKYLRENCDRNRKTKKRSKITNDYNILKASLNEKLRISTKLFDTMFEKYCKQNGPSFKWESKNKKGNLKGDFSEENIFVKSSKPVILNHHNDDIKNIVQIRLVDDGDRHVELTDAAKQKLIPPTPKHRQWLFSFDESVINNKTDMNGYWFIRAGESRSKMRWTHHRSDWLFDRASHRRSHPLSPTWFSDRRHNWFFRRAWARQQCRQSPHDGWCHFPQDETVTIPSSSFS